MNDTQHEPAYWRSLEQLAGTPEFQSILEREFQDGVADGPGLDDEFSRRKFLGVVAASVALAGMTGCRKPAREILPFNDRPQGMTPGIPRYYATAHDQGGYGVGVLVRSNDGRPTKIEGNPEHPASGGGTNAFMQAEILNLYDPGRSRGVMKAGEPARVDAEGVEHPYSLAAFLDAWRPRSAELAQREGQGLHVLMPPTTSRTVANMIGELRSVYPKAAVHSWAPVNRDETVAGSTLAFGSTLDAQHAFDRAEIVASFDADFLGLDSRDPGQIRDWAKTRKLDGPSSSMSRLYVAEASFTLTGSNADHRFQVSSGEIGAAVFALAAELGVGDATPLRTALDAHAGSEFFKNGTNWIKAIAADLRRHAGRSIVLVGDRQPAVVQAVGHAINLKLQNVGGPTGEQPIHFTSIAAGMDGAATTSIQNLAAEMNAGRVDTLVCIGTNPVYDAPAELEFGRALSNVAFSVHVGLHADETARGCSWHVNAAHELEAWGDLLAVDGTPGIVQPLIAPLFGGVSAIEFLAHLLELDSTEGYALVRQMMQDGPEFARAGSDDFDAWWNRVLHDGFVTGATALVVNVPTLRAADVTRAVEAHAVPAAPSAQSMELNFRPCPTVFDGRYSNNAWMQELPAPLEKLTWDNAVTIGRGTAETLGLRNRDVVTVEVGGRSVEGAIWIVPGHAAYSATVTLGYGRNLGDELGVAADAGFNAYRVRTSSGMHFASGVKLTKTGRSYDLVSTQDHGSMEGRGLIRESTVDGYRANPTFAPDASPLAKAAKLEDKGEPDLLKSLWKERDYSTGYQWAMVIDLNTCIGCNACVVACVAENNIPMVGKSQVAAGREMFWNRVDRYYSGSQLDDDMGDDPQVVHQMVPCMQCENAPCEAVCPVAATVHSPEGLNDMAYNRCIGTRYCSNNCPYKVRRFNWFNFHKDLTETDTRRMQYNPDVTVRSRGVMEKCTYCTQRINAAKFRAKTESRTVVDADLQTACQQGCPADAIAFGNKLDPSSRVAAWRASDRNYAMLSELNVKPRTTFLAKVRNPNPELS